MEERQRPPAPTILGPADPNSDWVVFAGEKDESVFAARDAYEHWFGLAVGSAPDQEELDAMIRRADRVVVKATGMSRGRAMNEETVVDRGDRDTLDALARALRIRADTDVEYCGCLGGPTIEFFTGAELIATIGIQHKERIRWSRWLSDASLADPGRFLSWLDGMGVNSRLLELLSTNAYDQNGFSQVGFRRPGPQPLSAAEQRVRVLEVDRERGRAADEILTELDREISTDPSVALAYAIRGIVHATLGWHDRAAADLAQARGLGLVHEELMSRRAILLHQMGLLPEALEECNDAIALAPRHPPGWNSRGVLLRELEQLPDAIRDFREAARLSPRWIWPELNLAVTLRALGDLEGARAAARRAAALLPETHTASDVAEQEARRLVAELLESP